MKTYTSNDLALTALADFILCGRLFATAKAIRRLRVPNVAYIGM